MGSPKALLDFQGETFIDRLIRVLGEVCDPVIVVLGFHADLIRSKAKGHARFVVNPSPERGQLSSLQTALAAVPPDADGFLFLPVDCPAVEAKTVSRVAGTFVQRDAGTLLVIPRVTIRGRTAPDEVKRGHPVCAARSLIPEFMELPSNGQAKDVVHQHIAQTQYVDVNDAGILTDIDDADAYRRLAGAKDPDAVGNRGHQ